MKKNIAAGLLACGWLPVLDAGPAAADTITSVNLVKGQDYVLEASGYDCDPVQLVNPQGVATVNINACIDPDNGAEFRAAYTATYHIRIVGDDPYASAEVVTDCRQDAKTLCILKPGTSQQRRFAYFDDDDWHKLSLAKGRTYRFTYNRVPLDGGPQAELSIRDAAGKYLARTGQISDGGTLTFKPKKAGTYYLSIYNEDIDGGGTYAISMK